MTSGSSTTRQANDRWHRQFIVHEQRKTLHSHCPLCGNEVGQVTTACANCGATFKEADTRVTA
jgi:predicted amidophosphoribosyltransferase